jgi:hypothetical protein
MTVPLKTLEQREAREPRSVPGSASPASALCSRMGGGRSLSRCRIGRPHAVSDQLPLYSAGGPSCGPRAGSNATT